MTKTSQNINLFSKKIEGGAVEDSRENSGQEAKVKTKKILLISALAIVLIIIGFGVFVYAEEGSLSIASIKSTFQKVKPAPAVSTQEESKAAEEVPVVSEIPADWKTYTINDLSLSFSYPPTWGDVSLKTSFGTTGTTNVISFGQSTESSKITMGYSTPNFTAERGGALFEGESASVNYYIDCQSFNQSPAYKTNSFISCKDIKAKNNILGIIISDNNPEGEMMAGPLARGIYITGMAKYPVIGMSTSDNSANTLSIFETIIKSFKTVDIATNWKTYSSSASSKKMPIPKVIKMEMLSQVSTSQIQSGTRQ